VNHLKVKDHNNLVRDTRSKAILNTDMAALLKRRREKEVNVTLNSLNEEVNTIKNEFLEIKQLLKQIVSKG
tara:strand:+ start:383 stop:595 length:213 start_codon:yes stop_codon:yes gene_type:complete